MFTLNCRGRLLVAETPLVMGIANITPDSFYKDSRFTIDNILGHVEVMLREGADIIDIGAQSTRPGSDFLTADEELGRLKDIVPALVDHFPEAFFSIDSFYSEVAKECVEAGFAMINDISGGEIDKEMISVTASLNVPYICMHMRGTPQTMTELNQYENLTREVLDYFIIKIQQCREAGIKDIIIDPGFGFSKNIEQNFELLSNLSALKITSKPILVGLSRKSTIYKTLHISAEESLNGTTALNTVALMKGAGILRVHDVKQAKECIKLFSKLS
ncbi:MAG: dihydropteroate synthase [Chitinophagaceae bacterium]|nr:dihydropteroate synthase [Chitinophagaceae bacterium]